MATDLDSPIVHVQSGAIAVGRDALGNVFVTGSGNDVKVTIVVADTRLIDHSPPVATPDGAKNPYKGLDSFQESDAVSFFGRRDMITRLWVLFQKLQHGNWPAVVACHRRVWLREIVPSRAGLLPELARQPMDGPEEAYRPDNETGRLSAGAHR